MAFNLFSLYTSLFYIISSFFFEQNVCQSVSVITFNESNEHYFTCILSSLFPYFHHQIQRVIHKQKLGYISIFAIKKYGNTIYHVRVCVCVYAHISNMSEIYWPMPRELLKFYIFYDLHFIKISKHLDLCMDKKNAYAQNNNCVCFRHRL